MAASSPEPRTALQLPEAGPGSPGGLGRRTAALVVDWLASLVIAVVLNGGIEPDRFDPALWTLVIFAVQVALLGWLQGASFGQRILGLQVAPVGKDRAGLVAMAVRTVLLCLVIPAAVMDSNGRGLHDIAAGTVVLRR
jgi:uncharacterized RDD family membrane protein YckC